MNTPPPLGNLPRFGIRGNAADRPGICKDVDGERAALGDPTNARSVVAGKLLEQPVNTSVADIAMMHFMPQEFAGLPSVPHARRG